MKTEEGVNCKPRSFIGRASRHLDRSPLCTLEEFLEQANALVVGTDRRGNLRFCSKLFLKLIGRRWEGLRGSPLLDLFPPGEQVRVREVLAAVLKEGREGRLEAGILAAGGKQIRVSLASTPVLGPGRRVRGMMAIGEDLSAAEALQRRLLQTEKLALLGRFAASVAHEINNPVTAVVGCAEALLSRRDRADAPDKDKLRRILDGCERILRLTRHLVSYARPASDKVERVQVHKLLDTALSYCEHVLSHHGISVERQYQTVPEVAGIKANLAQVFVNVITNACQAMCPGGVLQVAVARAGQGAAVRISDNGPGMDPATLQRVFEPFFSTKPEGIGSGLGLFIARSIVESHRGDIDVTSSVGRGTTFVIRLPAAKAGGARASLTLDNSLARSAI
jgi:PAS domain S-box-containing protein